MAQRLSITVEVEGQKKSASVLLSFALYSGCAKVSKPFRVPPPDISPADKLIPVVETGGHGALINDIQFTSDGKYLVTASDDKTVRAWDLSTGELHRVVRGQIGEG